MPHYLEKSVQVKTVELEDVKTAVLRIENGNLIIYINYQYNGISDSYSYTASTGEKNSMLNVVMKKAVFNLNKSLGFSDEEAMPDWEEE